MIERRIFFVNSRAHGRWAAGGTAGQTLKYLPWGRWTAIVEVELVGVELVLFGEPRLIWYHKLRRVGD